jgi:restriction system protein
MKTRFGQLEVSHGVRGGATYRLELWHDGLKKHRLIKSPEPEMVSRKAELQAAEWDERWSHVSARQQDRRSKEGQKSQQEANKRLRFFADSAAKKWPLRGSMAEAALLSCRTCGPMS